MLGCAHTTHRSPIQSVDAYLEASSEERSALLLDPEVTLGTLKAEPNVTISEVAREATWIRTDAPALKAVLVDGAWRLTAGVLDMRSAETPQQALIQLLRALEERDPVLLIALLPRAERAHWSVTRARDLLYSEPWRGTLVTLIKRLRHEHDDGPSDVLTDTWTVGDAEGHVVMAREEEGWRVSDIRPRRLFWRMMKDEALGP